MKTIAVGPARRKAFRYTHTGIILPDDIAEAIAVRIVEEHSDFSDCDDPEASILVTLNDLGSRDRLGKREAVEIAKRYKLAHQDGAAWSDAVDYHGYGDVLEVVTRWVENTFPELL